MILSTFPIQNQKNYLQHFFFDTNFVNLAYLFQKLGFCIIKYILSNLKASPKKTQFLFASPIEMLMIF